MSEATILAGFKTAFQNDPTISSLVKTILTDLPDLQTDIVPAPWLLIQPGTLTDAPVEAGDPHSGNQIQGTYSVLCFDELGEMSNLRVSQVMANMRAIATAIRANLRSDYTLGGACLWAGKGDGVTIHYGDAGIVQGLGNVPLYCLPIDVDTLDFVGQ
jgi:hypothetical protein